MRILWSHVLDTRGRSSSLDLGQENYSLWSNKGNTYKSINKQTNTLGKKNGTTKKKQDINKYNRKYKW